MSSLNRRSAAPQAAPAQERVDQEVQQLALLQSAEVHRLIAQSLPDESVNAGAATVEILQHRPGAGVTGIYRVPGGMETYLGITSERVSSQTMGTTRLSSECGPLVAWKHPLDPMLPGLRLATTPAAAAATWGEGEELSSLETISYRPLRRAVLAADFADGRRTYLKVLRQGRAADLVARHRILLDADMPVPVTVGDPVSDVVALRQGSGVSLAELFLADGAAAVRPGDFVDLLDALPEAVRSLPLRDAWTDRLPSYAAAAVSALPDCQRRILRLEQEVLSGLQVTDRGPVVATHGDFYEANLLMSGSKISCLLDVDSLGPGYRVDDLACFLGHLAVLPAVDSRYIHAPAAFDRFARAFAEGVDPEALRIRSASVALSLVPGARSTRFSGWEAQAEHRLRCAEVLLGLTPAAGDLPHWPTVL